MDNNPKMSPARKRRAKELAAMGLPEGERPQEPRQLTVQEVIQGTYLEAMKAIGCIIAYTDGFLKIGPDRNNDYIWIAYRWSRGRWAGRYVLSKVTAETLWVGLMDIQRQVDACEAGKQTPTLDQGPRARELS